MNLADRMMQLRKARGISQEELAEHLGVSRQAVSKWESGQSTPEVEKIILASEFFDVTTDYLLIGIAPGSLPEKRAPAAGIFAAVGTAMNLIGVVLAAIIRYTMQTAAALATGAVFQILGCTVYAVGMAIADTTTKGAAQRRFRAVQVWVLPVLPLSAACNFLAAGKLIASCSLTAFPGVILSFFAMYFAVGIAGTIWVRRQECKKGGTV